MAKDLLAPQRRVLVVDDNVDAAESTATLLRLCAHEVRTAHDGPYALQVARSFRPEFVFLDLALPGMDGFQVARVLRGEGVGSMRIIAVTGFANEEARRTAFEAGCDQYIVKPMDPVFLDSLLGKKR
jgi:two-component system CheB/CheR fusion protein